MRLPWRPRIARRPGPVRGRPRVAVLTVVRDEAEMLPRWVAYYGAEVGVENLIVFDDNSVDGGTEDLPCTVHRIPGFPAGRFEASRVRLVSGVAAGLLATYDVVIFTDADEFLVPDPDRHESLRAFLRARSETPVLASLALNVLHHGPTEAPLDPRRPVLDQRSYAKFAAMMCKPAVKRIPAAWAAASHGVYAEYLPDPELFMLHLKWADREQLRRAGERRHAVMTQDGRGKASSWRHGGDDLVRTLDEFFEGRPLDEAPEFDPSTLDLATLVRREGEAWRAPKIAQVKAMRSGPLLRIPPRLRGVV